MRRSIAHSFANIERAQTHILTVKTEFDPVHPELGNALQMAMLMLEEVNTLLKNWCVECWGHIPENLDAWRNMPEDEVWKDEPDTELGRNR
jgi:hypothetical protein